MLNTSYHDTETLLTLIEEKNAEIAFLERRLHARSHDPAWGIAKDCAVFDRIACLPPTLPVRAAVGDIRDLKQWNGAMGAQSPFDAIIARGFASIDLRSGDILGRGDGGDKIFLICPAGRGAEVDVSALINRINATLRATPLRSTERRAYVRGSCAKAWGPWVGKVVEALHYLGVRRVIDYPRIDWIAVEDGAAAGVLARIEQADRKLFEAKALCLRGAM